MNNKLKKRLRTIGHELKPVVTIAGNGLSESVLAELNRALNDHELIKARVVGDREERKAMAAEIGAIEALEIVQSIGGILLLYRPSREPDPAKSNILRSGVV